MGSNQQLRPHASSSHTTHRLNRTTPGFPLPRQSQAMTSHMRAQSHETLANLYLHFPRPQSPSFPSLKKRPVVQKTLPLYAFTFSTCRQNKIIGEILLRFERRKKFCCDFWYSSPPFLKHSGSPRGGGGGGGCVAGWLSCC